MSFYFLILLIGAEIVSTLVKEEDDQNKVEPMMYSAHDNLLSVTQLSNPKGKNFTFANLW